MADTPTQSLIEALIARGLPTLNFDQLLIVAAYLVAERRKLQAQLDDAAQINEEWRQGVDKLSRQLAHANQQLELFTKD